MSTERPRRSSTFFDSCRHTPNHTRISYSPATNKHARHAKPGTSTAVATNTYSLGLHELNELRERDLAVAVGVQAVQQQLHVVTRDVHAEAAKVLAELVAVDGLALVVVKLIEHLAQVHEARRSGVAFLQTQHVPQRTS